MNSIFELIKKEEKRQKETITLIPSENYASRAVREATGSGLMNKYAEGYPGRRYYQGNGVIDEIEAYAIERAKKLFNVSHVNVQPYSGSPANAAVLMALVEPGGKVMGMKLAAGGHLTHGHPKITFSGKYYKSVQYDVGIDGKIDFDEVTRLAREEKPRLIIVGTTAYPRILDWKKFRKVADEVGAYLLADISHIAGLVVAGVHPSPVDEVDVVMTTTHKTLRGPRGAMLMVTKRGLAKDPDMGKKIDRAVFPGLQGGPHENTVAAIAVCLDEAGTAKFKKYGLLIVKNAQALATELISLGLSLSTGGTDNHLMVIDLRNKNISGKEAAVALEEAGIVTNCNSIPHDPNPPMNPSGLRIGTPAVTSQGMREKEMKVIAKWIDQIITNFKLPISNKGLVREIRNEVKAMCKRFPMP